MTNIFANITLNHHLKVRKDKKLYPQTFFKNITEVHLRHTRTSIMDNFQTISSFTEMESVML